jgi:uncharacterized protein YdbL (DUF1318 family)
MNTHRLRLLFACLALSGAAVTIRAEDITAVRERMEQRIPRIDALKMQETLGENNRGFLEVRAASAEASDIASSENRDRTAVYSALARKTGASAETVGRARAKQIAANSAGGVWLQRESGEWYKK